MEARGGGGTPHLEETVSPHPGLGAHTLRPTVPYALQAYNGNENKQSCMEVQQKSCGDNLPYVTQYVVNRMILLTVLQNGCEWKNLQPFKDFEIYLLNVQKIMSCTYIDQFLLFPNQQFAVKIFCLTKDFILYPCEATGTQLLLSF